MAAPLGVSKKGSWSRPGMQNVSDEGTAWAIFTCCFNMKYKICVCGSKG